MSWHIIIMCHDYVELRYADPVNKSLFSLRHDPSVRPARIRAVTGRSYLSYDIDFGSDTYYEPASSSLSSSLAGHVKIGIIVISRASRSAVCFPTEPRRVPGLQGKKHLPVRGFSGILAK